MVAIAAGNDWPSCGAHPRVHDNQVNCSGREVIVGLGNRERTIEYIKRLNRVTNIDNLSTRNDPKYHSLDRADKVIIKAKVGGQRDDWTMPQLLPHCLRERTFPGDFESNACMILSQGTVVTIA